METTDLPETTTMPTRRRGFTAVDLLAATAAAGIAVAVAQAPAARAAANQLAKAVAC